MSVTSSEDQAPAQHPLEELDAVTIRFAGDSGDGMQLTGTQFTATSAIIGNDISTLPDFPAEIRAPAGSLPGVSGYQLNFSSRDIRTPGDEPQVLVAMNPAALKVNIKDLEPGGILVLNTDEFNEGNLKKAGYASNPLNDGSISGYRVFQIPITSLKWIEDKFGAKPEVAEANTMALRAGYNYADTMELFTTHYHVGKAQIRPGRYRNITGNEATAIGFITASQLAGRPIFYGSYPITPASDVLHELSKHKNFGVKTFQAEDEIAAIGAAFAGHIGLTGTSGPGVALKSEAIGLAVMTELPLIVIDVQRGGPSTGLP